jgi:hypothetical protein
MGKRKRKTLPANFEELLKGSDHATIIAALEPCEPDARGGFGGRTALAFGDCSDELSRWLVARGASVDAVDKYGNTPLQSRITYGGSIEVLLELGANVDYAGGSLGTALHAAACTNRLADELVRTLLAAGAQVDAPNRRKMSPLELALARAHNTGLPQLVRVARLLLDAGAERRESMKASVKRIGETFEFHRKGFNEEYVETASAALDELYALFDVPPVPRRRTHDGVSRIAASPGTWQQQHKELWNLLVPSSGPAATVQGEVVRIAGRIADEIHRNGGINWDEAYRAMGRAFLEHLASGTALLDSDVATARASLRGRPDDSQADELMRLAVRWVQWNPNPVPLSPPDYRR